MGVHYPPHIVDGSSSGGSSVVSQLVDEDKMTTRILEIVGLVVVLAALAILNAMLTYGEDGD